MSKLIDMVNSTSLQEFNKQSALASQERVKHAYSEWLITKSHIKRIAKKHHTDPGKLTKYILAQNHRLTTFDENVFNIIDTEEKAYWLGFLFADGSMSNQKRANLELSLQLNDITHIEKFTKFLKCDRSVRYDTYRCRFSASSKKLYTDLIKHGCTSKKSLTIKFPKLVSALVRHFIRGYFDGDGSIVRSRKSDMLYTSLILCSGSAEFLKQVVIEFNNYTHSECKQTGYKRPGAELYSICLKDQLCKRFLNWLYEDATIYLDRKYNRYVNSIAVLSRNVKNNNRTISVKGVIPNTEISKQINKCLPS